MYVAYLSQVVLPVSLTCNSLCLIFYDPCANEGLKKNLLQFCNLYDVFFYILLKIQHSKCSFKILIDRFYYKFFQTVVHYGQQQTFCMTFAQVFIASKDSFPTIQYNLIMANIDTVTMKNIMNFKKFLIYDTYKDI